MYRLLIVDDEPIIVEGLYDCFQQQDDLPCEVYKACSGVEALAIARRVRVDVLLTDIEMPVMNGLALQAEIARIWPRCKTIFLTGYSDFQYVQTSLRSGAFDYVLKREEDRKVVQSVGRAIAAITAENSYDRLLQDARDRMTQALPALRREYLLELLQGEPATPAARAARFAELGISLRAHDDAHVVIGRIDEWRDDIRPGDKSLFLYCIGNIIEEQFAGQFRVQFVMLAGDRFLWLMQPAENAAAANAAYILGTVESIQAACRTYLKVACSFVAGCEPCRWEDISAKYDRLSFQLANGLGLGSEILLSDSHPVAANDYEEQLKERDLSLLAQALERQDRDAFNAKFGELSAAVHDRHDLQSGAALALFYALSAMFMLYLNRHGLFAETMARIKPNKLLTVQEHASLDEALHFFRTLAETLFASADERSGEATSDVVRRVNEYINEHIGGDLSLTRLTEIVHLTPSYLSRLYKQQTRQSLTDYIMQAKLDKAKEMLATSPKKIYQIGFDLGFQSAPYFNRLFKKMANMTPQEYRNAYGTPET